MSPTRAAAGLILALSLVVIASCSEASSTDVTITAGDSSEQTTSSTSTSSTLAGDAPYVHPGSGELSARQIDMLEVLAGYGAAWKAKDGDLLATYMTEDAVVEYDEQDATYAVADGSLQTRVANGPYDTMRTFEPKMIYDNRIIHTGTVDAVGVRWVAVIRFTRSGEVLIDKETIFYGP